MDVEQLRQYCLSLPGTQENAPWTEPQYSQLLTFTVGGKWYCLLDLNNKFIDVKASPETITQMQERYQGTFPAWHMNKQHWLGVKLEADVSDEVIGTLLKEGYNLIVKSLSRKLRTELGL